MNGLEFIIKRIVVRVMHLLVTKNIPIKIAKQHGGVNRVFQSKGDDCKLK